MFVFIFKLSIKQSYFFYFYSLFKKIILLKQNNIVETILQNR
jgi:hypothetical protein